MSVVIVAVSCGGCGQTTHYGHTERINAFPWNTKQSGDHMTARENNIAVYQLALEYLHAILPEGMKAADLDKYYIGDGRDYATLTDIFEQFIQSAQNYQGMPNYIKFSDRRAQIKEILFDFDIAQIADCDVEQLYRTFRKAFDVTSTDSIFNAWHKWSKSIVDVAKFMLDFRGAEDFRAFVDQFDYNPLMRTALPLLISTKISGFGFALACDCLKELGFLNYAKPDTHLIDIFEALKLSGRDPVAVFEAIVRMSDFCKTVDQTASPYKIDKVLWLICSGRFYLDKITIGRHKDEFIPLAKKSISGCST